MEEQYQHDPADDHGFTPEDLEPRPFSAPPRHRLLWILAVVVVLILLAVLPPLVSVNRYQRQVAASISQSLGRPVHIGEITLNLLPFPGFTIKEFNVSDDPAFSSEPVIHASSVMARLRWRSLWRRRVEFSRITLSDASVNLVRRADGQWNLESILLQASRMPAAPTAQRGAGDRPRFPYIEATGARVNFKMGLEKLPVSLTEADFALWLPQAEQWRLRLEARPARTDAAITDTGLLRLEGSLGRAAHLPEVPVDLHASWTAAPLGAASTVLTGRDRGIRGELTFNATIKGTAGDNAFTTRLQLDRARRADFVPARLLDADITCTARALGNMHRLEDLHCAWPAGGSGLTVIGTVPDTLKPSSAQIQAVLQDLPASTLLDALRLASPRISPTLTLDGTVAAHVTCCTAPNWITAGDFDLSAATLKDGPDTPFTGTIHGTVVNDHLQIEPFPLALGGPTPAQLAAQIGWSGYSLQLTGPSTPEALQALAQAFPPFGDGLQPWYATPTLNLVSQHPWQTPQIWSPQPPAATQSSKLKTQSSKRTKSHR